MLLDHTNGSAHVLGQDLNGRSLLQSEGRIAMSQTGDGVLLPKGVVFEPTGGIDTLTGQTKA